MEKQEALSRWVKLDPDQQILPHFTPIAADAHGSTFGACGIRVSGNPAFIDAVLSRLKDLLEAESGSTRLVLSRQPVKPVRKGDLFESAESSPAPEPEEPPKVAHIGSRNGEVLWDEEEGEES